MLYSVGDKVIVKDHDYRLRQLGISVDAVGIIQSTFPDPFGSGCIYQVHFENKMSLWILDRYLNPTAPIAPELDEVQQEAAPVITIADAFIAASRASQPRYKGQSAAWKSEGKCPTCGELGRYHLSVAICSKHGEY